MCDRLAIAEPPPRAPPLTEAEQPLILEQCHCTELASPPPAQFIERELLREGVTHRPIVLHSNNGPAMKRATLAARLDHLGAAPSYSLSRMSDENPFSERLFYTCKYRPDYPPHSFPDVDEALDL